MKGDNTMVKKKAAGVDQLRDGVWTVALAGMGAAVLAKDGAYDLAKRWVKKGEQLEPTIKKSFTQLTKKREKVAQTVTKNTGTSLKKAWNYFPVVTKKDILDLSKRIDVLSAKVTSKPARKRTR
jgi:polyhydroxyalkanoate synthesis regulator phasin